MPLNDTAIGILSRLDTVGGDDCLFINTQTGRPSMTIVKVWSRLRGKAGFPQLRIHDLRHQLASFLLNSCRTLYEVQTILGHSDAKVTQRDAHLSSRSLQDAADTASAIIQGGGGGESPVTSRRARPGPRRGNRPLASIDLLPGGCMPID